MNDCDSQLYMIKYKSQLSSSNIDKEKHWTANQC